MDNIEVSPWATDPSLVPDISFADYLLKRLDTHLPALADKPWIVDVLTGRSVKYGEIEDLSRRVASAFSKLGLRHGDIIQIVTYEMAYVYIAMMAAWRIGVAVRGSFQQDKPEEYARQLREGAVKVALIDPETVSRMREACSDLGWDVTLINMGSEPVEGATSFDDLLKDDGAAFPANVEINPREDVMIILNTSGSTGKPKGAMYTHYGGVAMVFCCEPFLKPVRSYLTLAGCFSYSNFFCATSYFHSGNTLLCLAKFVREDFLKILLEYKPEATMMYPYVLSWFARDPEVLKHDLRFLKTIGIGGSVMDYATLKILEKAFPKILFFQIYALSETGGITLTVFAMKYPTEKIKTCEFEGTSYVSSGMLYPYNKAKIVDPESGAILGRMQKGEILVHTPYVMKGYLVHVTLKPNRVDIDDEGWYHTGDLGFFDEEGQLYVQERKSFMFKYYMFFVSPSDIEAVLSEHPAVQEVGVVGIPNPETTSLARAMVVLRPGAQATASELEAHVSQRLPSQKHLHGGVCFVDSLPGNQGGKLDRAALMEMAIKMQQGQDSKMSNIEISPMAGDPAEVPNHSITTFLFEQLEKHLPRLEDHPWVVDVVTGRTLKFGEIEEKSRRVASALSRLGLGHGDVLYFVTYDLVDLYATVMAAWRVGAAIRGSVQTAEADEYVHQMREGNVKMVLIDAKTAPKIKEACRKLEWSVTLVSLGPEPVGGAKAFDDLVKDDGTAFPDVTINPKEDALVIPNTSGSTGFPKGAVHTHFSFTSLMYGMRALASPNTQLTISNNFAINNVFIAVTTLYGGASCYLMTEFKTEKLFGYIEKYKPNGITLYPFVASWFARAPEITSLDMSFLRTIVISGAVLDPTTSKLITKALPRVLIAQSYSLSECFGVCVTFFSMTSPTDIAVKMCEFEGETYVSSGKPYPYAKVKVVDVETGKEALPRMQSGEILVQSTYTMKGYLKQDNKLDRGDIDEDGWLHTGDIGFFDQNGCLYVMDRKSSIFKYYMNFVSPHTIEAVLLEHPAVNTAGVIGVPNTETTNLARGFVSLRPGAQVTAAELEAHVSQRLPTHMHLHGGVTFMDKLPANRGGKVDRVKLKEIAMEEKKESIKVESIPTTKLKQVTIEEKKESIEVESIPTTKLKQVTIEEKKEVAGEEDSTPVTKVKHQSCCNLI